MFTKVLSKNTKKALALLSKCEFLDQAYLGGGTALALQIGHRTSIDLDFFISREFDAQRLLVSLEKVCAFELEKRSWGTILGRVEGVQFALFVYKYPVLFPFKSLFGINILDIGDIAVMKLDAIAARGTKRDFVDLYFICQERFSLKEILYFYEKKYKKLASNIVHLKKSLVYFIDADKDKMPKMLKRVNWKDVKRYFEEEVKKLV